MNAVQFIGARIRHDDAGCEFSFIVFSFALRTPIAAFTPASPPLTVLRTVNHLQHYIP